MWTNPHNACNTIPVKHHPGSWGLQINLIGLNSELEWEGPGYSGSDHTQGAFPYLGIPELPLVHRGVEGDGWVNWMKRCLEHFWRMPRYESDWTQVRATIRAYAVVKRTEYEYLCIHVSSGDNWLVALFQVTWALLRLRNLQGIWSIKLIGLVLSWTLDL